MAKTRPPPAAAPEPAPAARRRGDPPGAVGHPGPGRGPRSRARPRVDHRGEVRVSPDLRHATALVLPLGGSTPPRCWSALNRNRAEIRRLVTGPHRPEVLAGARASGPTPDSTRSTGPAISALARRSGATSRTERRDGMPPPRGRPVHGWLLVDKPAGPSSAAVVAKAKWALDARKAGHAGTLDPAATGLLAVAFGEATKTVPFVADARKAYRFTVRWGAHRPPTTPRARSSPQRVARRGEIRAALPAFTGDILQVPPQVRRSRSRAARLRPRPRRRDPRARRPARCMWRGSSSSRRPTGTPPSSR